MNSIFEGRTSDSPYIDMIWRGRTGPDYLAVCPADTRWHLFFTWYEGQARVMAEGALTQSITKTQPEGMEFLVIKFALGAFMPQIPACELVDGNAILPEANSKTFWLKGSAWQLPDFDNAETFVERLVREELLVVDPVVNAVMQNQQPDWSFRTVRRRFVQATGLTQGTIRQIERAQQAASLLEQGVPILDAVYQAGYADQPHLTRSLKRYYGRTPAQILQGAAP